MLDHPSSRVDLRSDTVTQPTKGMREAMAASVVPDLPCAWKHVFFTFPAAAEVFYQNKMDHGWVGGEWIRNNALQRLIARSGWKRTAWMDICGFLVCSLFFVLNFLRASNIQAYLA